MKPNTSYIEFSSDVTEEGYKLICLPFAGGGASHYAKWGERLAPIEVLPLQLPGRENRIKDTPYQNSEELLEKLVEVLIPYLQSGRYSIFGHSMGGVLGFELAKRLEARKIFPDVCFISGTCIPEYLKIQQLGTPIDAMSDQNFMRLVATFGAMDENNVLLQYPEIREIYLRVLRADFNVIQSYVRQDQKVKCPIVALCGTEDPSENLTNMRDWENYTEASVSYRSYPGDHFYLDKNLGDLSADIQQILSKYRV